MRYKFGSWTISFIFVGGFIGLLIPWMKWGVDFGVILGVATGWIVGGLVNGYVEELEEKREEKEDREMRKFREGLHHKGSIVQRLDRIEKKIDKMKDRAG